MVFLVEVLFLPLAIYRNDIVRVVFLSCLRSSGSLTSLIAMQLSTHEKNYQSYIICVWGLLHMLFWLQQTFLAFRFFKINIQTKLLKTSSNIKIPQLYRIKMYYSGIYLLCVCAQIAFLCIPFVGVDNVGISLSVK